MVGADLPAVLAIEEATYHEPWTEGIFRDCLRMGYTGRVLEVAAGPGEGAGLAGYGLISAAAGECHILNLCTAPEQRGRGLGRLLLRALLAEGRLAGAEQAFLEVRPSNSAAVALYRAEGFETVGVREGYYPAVGGREDAWVLRRALI
ncbi:MAG: ribosomal protein S18-alanine N-acetyltransferase [Thiohalospira sp.]|uniref:ribosomal protein S18-alanine N-acetyltransferase n=1 Tax=Thiohalospira sp. TaxID=3080549 RepID=UPI00398113B9